MSLILTKHHSITLTLWKPAAVSLVCWFNCQSAHFFLSSLIGQSPFRVHLLIALASFSFHNYNESWNSVAFFFLFFFSTCDNNYDNNSFWTDTDQEWAFKKRIASCQGGVWSSDLLNNVWQWIICIVVVIVNFIIVYTPFDGFAWMWQQRQKYKIKGCVYWSFHAVQFIPLLQT